MLENIDNILNSVFYDQTMIRNWNNYRSSTYYVGDLTWDEVAKIVHNIFDEIRKIL